MGYLQAAVQQPPGQASRLAIQNMHAADQAAALEQLIQKHAACVQALAVSVPVVIAHGDPKLIVSQPKALAEDSGATCNSAA
jgi:hypothetical protein